MSKFIENYNKYLQEKCINKNYIALKTNIDKMKLKLILDGDLLPILSFILILKAIFLQPLLYHFKLSWDE